MAKKISGPKLKQLIPGNPGTSFVVCLLYALNQKYEVKIKNEDQLSIFTEGIVNSRRVFHSGILNTIAIKFGHKIYGFTNNKIVLNLAKREINKKSVSFSLNPLDHRSFLKLLDRFQFVTLSVDTFFFYPYYHDYHFCCLGKLNDKYILFEPKRGVLNEIKPEYIKKLSDSVKKDLKDAILAFCC